MRLQQNSHSFMYKLLLLIIIVLAAFRTLHPLQTPVRVLCYTPRKQIPGFRQLDGMVRRVAVNNEVLLMLVDKGYYSMFMSNYMYGKLYEITNVVVSVMDIGTYNKLKSQNIPVAFLDPVFFHGSFQESFSDYGSTEFNFKMRMKLELVKHVLENGFNVLYVDCDVTIFKNPFPFFKKYPDYSVVAQQDETICAGFMYLRPYRNTLDFLNLVSQRLLTTNAHDQDIIVSLLPVFPLKYALLPQDRFPSGGVFFNQYQYYWDRHEDELYIFHNNYVIGKRNKELRMREMHLYVVDIDGEYSDPTRKYLTFEVADSNDLANTLMRMVEMANDLNRTLVLPPTRCKDFTTRWVWCNMCAMEPFHCHRSVLEQANNGYRESVFFTNPKVPATLKYQDAHNPIHRFDSQCNSAYAYHSTFPAHRRHRNPTICHTCKSLGGGRRSEF